MINKLEAAKDDLIQMPKEATVKLQEKMNLDDIFDKYDIVSVEKHRKEDPIPGEELPEYIHENCNWYKLYFKPGEHINCSAYYKNSPVIASVKYEHSLKQFRGINIILLIFSNCKNEECDCESIGSIKYRSNKSDI